MTSLLGNLRGTVQVALDAGRHLAWYVNYQTGGAGPREQVHPVLATSASTRARNAA